MNYPAAELRGIMQDLRYFVIIPFGSAVSPIKGVLSMPRFTTHSGSQLLRSKRKGKIMGELKVEIFNLFRDKSYFSYTGVEPL